MKRLLTSLILTVGSFVLIPSIVSATEPIYDWVGGVPVISNDEYEWVGGKPYVFYYNEASTDVNISNLPTSKDFGLVQPGSTYYANGSAYSNPVTAGQCFFAVTNVGATCDISLSCTDFTGGTTWTLVSGSPVENQIKVVAVYAGQDPDAGLVLTNADQLFYSDLATDATLNWDLKLQTGGVGVGSAGTFSDSTQKTATIVITAS